MVNITMGETWAQHTVTRVVQSCAMQYTEMSNSEHVLQGGVTHELELLSKCVWWQCMWTDAFRLSELATKSKRSSQQNQHTD